MFHAFMRRVASGFALAGVFATLSLAAPARADDKDRAQAVFSEAKDLYKRGQYRAAVTKLEEARRLDPGAKELVYNLALVHEKLFEVDKAIPFFELYLTLEQDEDERARVRAVVKRLEGARADLEKQRKAEAAAASASASAAHPAPPPAPPAAQERRRGKLDAWVYTAGGVSAIALLGGVYFGVRALGSNPGSTKTGPDKSIRELQEDADATKSSATNADISLAIAIAAGGAAAGLYLLRTREVPASAVVVPVRGGAAAALEGRF